MAAATTVLTVIGVEAGVVFGKENPAEKPGAELALEKELHEEPYKLVVVLVVEVIDDTVEAEVDGTDPNLKRDVAVKKSADAETEKFLFPSEFSIAKAVVVALILLNFLE